MWSIFEGHANELLHYSMRYFYLLSILIHLIGNEHRHRQRRRLRMSMMRTFPLKHLPAAIGENERSRKKWLFFVWMISVSGK